ncbi:hypothetical protein NPX13_g7752 [Xylaria arbuscula]|uniref:Uncharacterized protein n=1 Tax=Xylaria arbuscula TaxID=114810 RepID=A0A9W8N9Q8_9PEZI|nr:hypothetical protein NPX13_g7752 [Xylaria arbuscula]
MGKQDYLLVTSESTPGLCPQCWILLYQLEAAIGANDDSQVGFDTWQLYRRLGWMHKDLLLVVDLVYVIQRAKEQMKNWQEPRHEEQWMLRQWEDLFAEFKEWITERLEKRDAEGKLYFPPGEERGVRMDKKSVLRHLVSWILINMALGKFNDLDVLEFREGLDKAFNNLIYQWDTHFDEEPGSEPAKREFVRYWSSWLAVRERVPRQEEGESSYQYMA